MKYLIVVDFQKDFTTGALGNPECVAAATRFIQDMPHLLDADTKVIYTKDTHGENYMNTEEGKHLPVPHCIRGTDGWELHPGVLCSPQYLTVCTPYVDRGVVEKPTFGSLDLVNALYALSEGDAEMYPEMITFVGVCTDICVISNVMLVKAAFPDVPIYVNSNYCAGVTPESHQNALNAMKMCHIEVI